MNLTTIRKVDVPEYLRQSAFYQALDDDEEDTFTISMAHFKADPFVTDEQSFRNLLCTLRFWGADIIPTSVCDAAFNDDCLYFIPVASEFKAELRYLDGLIQLRTLPLENRLEHACGDGNLQIIRNIVSSNSIAISRVCFEAAARGGLFEAVNTGVVSAMLPPPKAIYPALNMCSSAPSLSSTRRTMRRSMDMSISFVSSHSMTESWRKCFLKSVCLVWKWCNVCTNQMCPGHLATQAL